MATAQRACWIELFGDDLPGLEATLDQVALTRAWREAIVLAGGEGPYAVFSALDEADRVVGFSALGPLLDPDGGGGGSGAKAGELVALWVTPSHQRAGHGSRLLAAIAGAARSSSAEFDRLSHWVARQDIHRQRFLRAAGFGPDGAERSWQTPAGELVDEQRWSALLTG
jgi:GNAT superfamily N-acetyltransferase